VHISFFLSVIVQAADLKFSAREAMLAQCIGMDVLDMIDAAFLRPGRFDKTLYIGLPDSTGRHDILLALSRVILFLFYLSSYSCVEPVIFHVFIVDAY